MGIAPEDVERVRAQTDIVAVVSEHVGLKKQGSRWVGLCPFHAEKSGSFSVNPELGLYYCLAGETRVVTWEGVRPIRELAGGTHRILTEKGRWVDAPFFSFGVQPLMKVVVGRNRQTKEIYATPEHRWLLRGKRGGRYERTTEQLIPGQGLCWSFPHNRLKAIAEISPFGIAHGITYGDGCIFNHMASADLHGEKDAQLLKWFPLSRTYQLTTAKGAPFTKVLDLPRYFKERPSLDESPSYLAGWLAGYFAADGHVAKDGTCCLNSADRSDLQFVRDVCTRLGIGTYGITTQLRPGFDGRDPSELHRIHFITEDLDERFFLIDEHRLRFSQCAKAWIRRGWMVKSVEPTERVEEVFCAVVDGTHSFVIEDNILTGNCFGCQAKGDVITFVRETQHLDFVGAVESLAGRAGITLTYTTSTEGEGRKKRKVLIDAMTTAVEWYHDRLLTSPDAATARGYLRSRGYDGDVVRKYKLGWAPDDWDALSRDLKVPSEVVRDTGLAFLNKRNRLQDSFRARVLFPIFDVRGDAVALGGRILPGSSDPAKYKNSPSTSIYDKSDTLYGLNWAKGPAVEQGEIVVCEGYTDVIGMGLAGVTWAVATCGTALTDRHFSTLKNFSRRIVLAYDADAAGQGAAERFYEWEAKYEVDVYVADLPRGADPGDLAQSDPEALRQSVAGAKRFLQFRLDRLLQRGDVRSAEGKAKLAHQAHQMITEHPDPIVREQYAGRVAAMLDLPQETLLRGLGSRSEPALKTRPQARSERPSLMVLLLAVHQPEDVAYVLDEVLFVDDVELAAYRALASAATLHEAIEVADPAAAELLQRLAVEEVDVEPDDVLTLLVAEAAQRALVDIEAGARSSVDPLTAAETIGWLKLRLEEAREAATRRTALEQLVAFLVERRAVEEGS